MMRYAVAAAAFLCVGCLFRDTPPPRYFEPPSALVETVEAPATNPGAAALRPIRLRRVQAAAYIGDQIVWRSSDVERGLYEQRRWTEGPTRYLERTMRRALDRTPGLRRVESGRVPVVDLELTAFDEVLAPAHEADVAVIAILRSADYVPIFERTFRSRQPIADADPGSTARAIGAALDDVVTQIAAAVAGQLPPTASQRQSTKTSR